MLKKTWNPYMKSCQWLAHWEVFWYLHSWVEILFLLRDMAELLGSSASEKNRQFWPIFYSQELVQTSGEAKCLFLTFRANVILSSLLQGIQETDIACPVCRVSHFCIIWDCLAIVNLSFGLSIFGTVFIYLFLQGI